MKLSEFDYELPESLIARFPLSERSGSRLMVLGRDSGEVEHHQVSHLPSFLTAGDLLVFNNTRVIPARLFGVRPSGGKVELLVERLLDERRFTAQVRSSKPLKPGAMLHIGDGGGSSYPVEVIGRQAELYELYFKTEKHIKAILDEVGHIPLPPYMHRMDNETDRQRYQTIYAKNDGAVAAPTAGLHFDESLLQALESKGIKTAFVTLHVGLGTFAPVRVENITDHVMHHEWMILSQETCDLIEETRERGNRVIAVGTTTARCLESVSKDGDLKPFTGDTNLFIYPGYQFRCIDGLMTNFHLPQSTLLMMISAFATYEGVMHAYRVAVSEGYRFFSYGDAMLIL